MGTGQPGHNSSWLNTLSTRPQATCSKMPPVCSCRLAQDGHAMHGPVPGAVTWGGASFHVLRPCARSKVIVKHENHPLVVEATLVSNLGPISWLLTIMRAINGILFGFAGRLVYYICDIVHRQLPLLLDMEVRLSRLSLLGHLDTQ